MVDGDVLADIRVLEDRTRFIAVMQGGVVKAGQVLRPRGSTSAREQRRAAVSASSSCPTLA